MRRLPSTAFALLALSLAAAPSPARQAPAAAPHPASPAAARPHQAADFAWIAGSWRGEIDGALIEEMWTPPAPGDKGAMLGMFRWLQGDKVVVYELLSIEPGADGLVLLLRHFGPGLLAWEEKDAPVVFHLVSSAPGEVTFDNRDPARPTRITYRKDGDDGLISVLERTRDGKPSGQDFRYRRAR
jgi:hypothetical protein